MFTHSAQDATIRPSAGQLAGAWMPPLRCAVYPVTREASVPQLGILRVLLQLASPCSLAGTTGVHGSLISALI